MKYSEMILKINKNENEQVRNFKPLQRLFLS